MALKDNLAYTGIAPRTPGDQLISTRRPTANDVQQYDIGFRWVIPTNNGAGSPPSNELWVLMSKPQNVAEWVQVTAGGAVTYVNHELLVGTGTATINQISPLGTSGMTLLSGGAGVDPAFGDLTVAHGGTSTTSFVTYTPVCGGTTATGALQSVASTGNLGDILTSQGAGALPQFVAPGAIGTITVPNGGTGDTSLLAYAVLTGGVTNVDPVQTVGSLGTLNQVLTSNGAGALPSWKNNSPTDTGFTSIVVQPFTGNGTYTPTANMKYCIVEAVGGGGAGGGTTGTGNLAGGGGGAGGYCRKVITAAAIGASKAVVIGAGGVGVAQNNGGSGANTTFGVILTASAGVGGVVSSSSGVAGTGGAGGAATGGDVNVAGQTGSGGLCGSTTPYMGGLGGSTMYGGGGPGGIFLGSGQNSTGYGSGGGGLSSAGGSLAAGGNGASGIVIVTEYIGA